MGELNYDVFRETLKEKFEHWKDEICNENVEVFPIDFERSLKEKSEFKLYKYTPYSMHTIENVLKQQIHISNIGVMNDVYEGIPQNDVETLSGENEKILGNMAKITCFTERPDNILMWAHYADSFKGICIEYDIKRLVGNDILHHLYPVLYEKKRKLYRDIDEICNELKELERYIADNAERNDYGYLDDILPLLLIKGDMWSYEKEWRIVYTLLDLYEENDATLYSGIIPFPCIKALYIGYRNKKAEDIKKLIECYNQLNEDNEKIKVYVSEICETEYKLQFRRIV